MKQYNIEECPICRHGALLIVKAVDNNRLLVICDDCESQWEDPEKAIAGEEPITEEVCGVKDATLEEIEARGWKKFVKNI